MFKLTSNKKIYYILGSIFLFIGLFCITLLPVLLKAFYKPLGDNVYRIFELIFFILGSVCYLSSYKYYKYQIITLLYVALFYYVFTQFYPLLIY